MAEGFGPFHVPQQSRRDKLRIVVPNHPSCQEAAATLDGCAGLLPLYDPSLLSSDMLACSNPSSAHEFHHQNNPLAGTGELCKQNTVYVGGFVNVSSSSTSSHHPYLDPHSSLTLNPGSIQDINTNPFLYSAQNLRDFDHSFNGGEVVTFKPEPLSLTHDSTTTGQGLSLSLSSQRYESALFAEKGIGGYVGRGIVAGGASTSNDVSRNSVPLGPFTGYASVLKASRFLKPAQQLLEEFCDVGRGICVESSCGDLALMDPSMENLSGNGAVDDPLTSACGDSIEHRRKRSTLLSMLQEVYRRYGLYYQQMQTVVASFESVAGLCNAAPFTSLALKTLLKHFRCLKNTISDQLRFASKTLGDGSYGRDGTPRMGTTNQGLHSQRPVHNSGILEHQHVWRPQRGLPERAVAVLKAWLFEHFLHPYPTDTDKQMLAKQTGLSRNQVSNWFINARVRLWKPMVEEIHMLETRQAQKASEGTDRNADNLVDHPPSADPLPSETQPQTTPTLKMQNPPTKRCRNELPTIPYRSNETMNFSYHNLSSHHDVGIGVGTTGGNSGVSLTLGLRQNNGISLSEPFPINIAHRFGLEANNDGYVFGGFEAPNRRFGNDIGG